MSGPLDSRFVESSPLDVAGPVPKSAASDIDEALGIAPGGLRGAPNPTGPPGIAGGLAKPGLEPGEPIDGDDNAPSDGVGIDAATLARSEISCRCQFFFKT